MGFYSLLSKGNLIELLTQMLTGAEILIQGDQFQVFVSSLLSYAYVGIF